MAAGGNAGGRKALMTRADNLRSSLKAQYNAVASSNASVASRLDSAENRIYIAQRNLRRASDEQAASAARALSHTLVMGRYAAKRGET